MHTLHTSPWAVPPLIPQNSPSFSHAFAANEWHDVGGVGVAPDSFRRGTSVHPHVAPNTACLNFILITIVTSGDNHAWRWSGRAALWGKRFESSDDITGFPLNGTRAERKNKSESLPAPWKASCRGIKKKKEKKKLLQVFKSNFFLIMTLNFNDCCACSMTECVRKGCKSSHVQNVLRFKCRNQGSSWCRFKWITC